MLLVRLPYEVAYMANTSPMMCHLAMAKGEE